MQLRHFMGASTARVLLCRMLAAWANRPPSSDFVALIRDLVVISDARRAARSEWPSHTSSHIAFSTVSLMRWVLPSHANDESHFEVRFEKGGGDYPSR